MTAFRTGPVGWFLTNRMQLLLCCNTPSIRFAGPYFPIRARRKKPRLAGRSASLRTRYGYQCDPYGT